MNKNIKCYESSDWSQEAQELFEKKIQKSKTNYKRARFMSLKALSLAKICDSYHQAAAVYLLHRAITGYPKEENLAYEQLGQIYESNGELQKAEECYRKAIETQDKSTHKGLPEYRLAKLLSLLEDHNKLKEADLLFDKIENEKVLLLVSGRLYEFLITRAKLAKKQGNFEQAVSYAKTVLDAAESEKISITKHPKTDMGQITQENLELMRDIIQKCEIGN
jgi:tetratricopeptide (TPR) repeat protein